MTVDRYTRTVLTIIAAALVVIALRGLNPIPPAWAAETMDCRVSGEIEIKRFSDDLKVQVDDFNFPGGSSSRPMYMKSAN